MRKELGMKKLTVCLMLGLLMLCSGCAKSSMDLIAEQMEASGDTEELEKLKKGVEETRKKDDEIVLGDKKVSFGQLDGGEYTNEYLSLKCSLNDDWVYYASDELDSLKSVVQGVMAGNVVGEALKYVDYRMDMKAENAKDQTAVNVAYMKLGMDDRLRYAGKTEREIIENVIEISNEQAHVYEQAGMKLKETGARTVTFLGENRTAQYMLCDFYGENYFTLQLFDYHTGEYATCITVSSFVEDKTIELLDLFTVYGK